ncbi:MAG: UDP-N-acetylmuramate dehydrogenase [Oscillospiraceae bacterium]|nr:UDP-N-acetylmuramate dehydrogenase [Oscillospiraceae bacterium]
MFDRNRAEAEIRRSFPDVALLRDEPMSRHTTFHIGGPAPLMIIPSSTEDTIGVLRLLESMDAAPLLVGNGSNLLVEDAPLSFPVVKTHTNKETPVILDSCRLEAPAGITLSRLAVFAQKAGLAGLAFAHGIPGTLGGALFMNAGAYGGEMAQVALETTALINGKLVIIRGADHDFGHRHSCFSSSGGCILSSVLQLQPGDSDSIACEMDELAAKRRASQPLEYPSAGSAFKRPAGAYAAALIDQCGLKGQGIGGARVSEKHAGFIINGGGASFDDVLAVIHMVQETVKKETGFELEPEIRIIRANP